MRQHAAKTRWTLAIAAVAIMAMASFTANGANASAPAASAQEVSKADMVKRGGYLVIATGCGDCHTPHKMGPNGPEADMDLFLSGHPAAMQLPPPPEPVGPWIATFAASNTAVAGPWGISYAQNLTPDPETGVAGSYTEAQFIMTIREGKKQGRGRALLPPMPWMAFRNFTDEDLRAIFAYLQTIKPVKNKVPEPVMAEMQGE